MSTDVVTVNPQMDEAEYDAFIALVRRIEKAKKPAAADLEELRAAFDKRPRLFLAIAPLSSRAREKMISTICSDGVTQEAFKANCNHKIKELGGDATSPLEKLLIENLVNAWLFNSINEIKFAHASEGSMSFEACLFWERRMVMSQKRLIRATEALARVRKLAQPAPSINQFAIGNNQANFAAIINPQS